MNTKYEEYVIMKSGRKELYVKILKALYGCVVSALLWYELFSEYLKEMGFEINPLQSCMQTRSFTINNAL